MTDFDFSEFDALLNKDALNEIENASKPTFDNTPLPPNTYNMTVEKLELSVSKNGFPLVYCDLKVKDGEHKNKHMFYRLYLTKSDGTLNPFAVHKSHLFLNGLTGGEITCSVKDGFETFNKEIQQVFDFAKKGYYEMNLTYTVSKKSNRSFENLEPISFFEYEE